MSDGWVTIATFSTLAEAHLARQRLLERDIDSALADVYMGGLGAHGDSAGGIKVNVHESNAELARQVLATVEPVPEAELDREAIEDVGSDGSEPGK